MVHALSFGLNWIEWVVSKRAFKWVASARGIYSSRGIALKSRDSLKNKSRRDFHHNHSWLIWDQDQASDSCLLRKYPTIKSQFRWNDFVLSFGAVANLCQQGLLSKIMTIADQDIDLQKSIVDQVRCESCDHVFWEKMFLASVAGSFLVCGDKHMHVALLQYTNKLS